MRQRRHAIGLAMALTCGLATIACAEVHVEGSPTAVRVTTGDRRCSVGVCRNFQRTISHSDSPRCSRQQNLFGLIRTGDFSPARRLQLCDQEGSGNDRNRRFRQAWRGSDLAPGDQSPADQRYLIAMAMTAAKPRPKIQKSGNMWRHPKMKRGHLLRQVLRAKPPATLISALSGPTEALLRCLCLLGSAEEMTECAA